MRQSPTLAVIELCEFGSRVQELVDAGVTMLHYDIMDGHYVPQTLSKVAARIFELCST